MAKGAIAKAEVIKKIQTAFGADYVGEYDKKIYVWAQENGERIQVAISLTCPKVPVAVQSAPATNANGDWDFENTETTVSTDEFAPAEFSEEERQNVTDLMARLGL